MREPAKRICVQLVMTIDRSGPSTENSEQRIDDAVEAIRSMSQDLADEVAPQPTWIDQICIATRGAPIQSLAIAFLVGVILARR